MQQTGVQLVGEAGNIAALCRAAATSQPDIVVFDLRLLEHEDGDDLAALPQRAPRTRALFLGSEAEREYCAQLLPLEAWSLVTLDASVSAVAAAIRTLANWPQPRVGSARPPRLTARENEIARLVAAGRRNYEVAAHFKISEDTVKRHLTNIYRKLGIHERVALVRYVKQAGLPLSGRAATVTRLNPNRRPRC